MAGGYEFRREVFFDLRNQVDQIERFMYIAIRIAVFGNFDNIRGCRKNNNRNTFKGFNSFDFLA
jgi:hypothetical protein